MKLGCVGRGGRSPRCIAIIAFTDERSSNGGAPVKTCASGSEPWLSHVILSVTHLNHNHRERENVRFIAIFPLVPNLRRDPPHREAILNRSTPHRMRVFGDLRETKVRDAYVTRVFHKDVGLVRCKWDMKQDRKRLRTPFRSPCTTLREWR